MQEILEAITGMEKRLNERLDRIERQNLEIWEAIQRLEKEQPADIMAMLQRLEKKMDGHQAGTKALNERLFRVEGSLLQHEIEIMKLKGEAL